MEVLIKELKDELHSLLLEPVTEEHRKKICNEFFDGALRKIEKYGTLKGLNLARAEVIITDSKITKMIEDEVNN